MIKAVVIDVYSSENHYGNRLVRIFDRFFAEPFIMVCFTGISFSTGFIPNKIRKILRRRITNS
jgi:hypothetical protein